MGSIGLRIALFVLGGVAILSGGLKVRERARAYYGGFGLGLLEILAGMALMGSTVPGMATDATMVVLARLTGLLIVISSTAHIFRARRLRRAREESEGGRLYSQIKYGDAIGGIVMPEGVETSLTDTAGGATPGAEDDEQHVQELPEADPPLT